MRFHLDPVVRDAWREGDLKVAQQAAVQVPEHTRIAWARSVAVAALPGLAARPDLVWADGVKETSAEDYPPWTHVTEMRDGHFIWDGDRDSERAGRYEIEWVAPELAPAERDRLGIRREDF